MRKHLCRLATVTVVLFCVIWIQNGWGSIYILESYEQSVESKYLAAALIARGKIVDVRLEDAPRDSASYRISFEIEDLLKGREQGSVEVFSTASKLLRCLPSDVDLSQGDEVHLDLLAQHLPLEANFVCSHRSSIEDYALFQCMDNEEWDEIEKFALEHTQREEEAQRLSAEINEIYYGYRAGAVTLEEASERGQALEQRYPEFGEEMEESRRASQRAEQLVLRYREILRSLQAEEIDREEATRLMNELYENNVEQRYIVEMWAERGGFPIWGKEAD